MSPFLIAIYLCICTFHFTTEATTFHHKKFRPETRIINGKEVTPHAYPYQVYFKGKSFLFSERCSGSLIAPDVILTAAHCLTGMFRVDITLGAHNISKLEPTQIKITSKKFIYHEEYDENTLMNDVGLIFLPEPVELSQYVSTVKLTNATLETFTNKTGKVLGWGRTKESINDKGSSVLKEVDVRIISNDECKAIHPYGPVIKDIHMCTDGTGPKGACDGDSGSAITVDGVQVGITSFTYKNCESGKPSVYTRISSFKEWIKSKSGVNI